MSLDELLKENQDVLRRMKEEDDPHSIRRMAHDWWNWDIAPPEQYVQAVHDYIHEHDDEFRGAVPQ